MKLLRTHVLANVTHNSIAHRPSALFPSPMTLEAGGIPRGHIAAAVREVDLLDHLCGVVWDLGKVFSKLRRYVDDIGGCGKPRFFRPESSLDLLCKI